MNTDNSFVKKYRLLKDLPNCKAGTIFIQHPKAINRYYPEKSYEDGEHKYDNLSLLGFCHWEIRDNGDWFEEVLTPPPTPVKERIDISRLQVHDNFRGNGNDSFWYQFCSSKYLSIGDCNNLSTQIEAALNEDTVVEDEKYQRALKNFYDCNESVKKAYAEQAERIRNGLSIIANWELPPSGKFWDDEEIRPTSYETEYGSNGVRDYMKSIATNLLQLLPLPEKTDTVVEDKSDNKLFYIEIAAVSGHDKYLGYEVNVGKMKYMTAWDSNGEPKLTSGNFIECGENLKRQIVFPNPYGIYTKQEVDAIREESFYKARETKPKEKFYEGRPSEYLYKYGTFKDYQDSLTNDFIRQSKPMTEADVICPPPQPSVNTVKANLHQVTNPSKPFYQPTAADTGKEWEVTSIMDNNGKVWEQEMYKGEPHFCGNTYGYVLSSKIRPNYWSIHSVCRLSDNCVFTVGNKINVYRDSGFKGVRTIERFEIKDGVLKEIDELGESKLSQIHPYLPKPTNEKPPPKEQSKPVLFTTEDGKPVYKNDLLTVVELPSYNTAQIIKMDGRQHEGQLYFSTKSAAEQYILENKPCLSAKEIYSITAKYGLAFVEFEKEIEQKIKEKLKQ